MIRSRFDRFSQALVRAALEGYCDVETDVDLSVDMGRIKLTVPTDPAKETYADDQEFVMETQDLVEAWRRERVLSVATLIDVLAD